MVSIERLLECTHKEAGDLIFFHANQAVKIGNYGRLVIAYPDADTFVSALHYFCKLKYFDLKELWFTSGQGKSWTFFPVHDLAKDLDSNLVEVLPAIHSLNGFDTNNKVGTKSRAVKEEADC